MSRHLTLVASRAAELPGSAPRYEVHLRQQGAVEMGVEVWRVPSPVTPQLVTPVRLAGLRGRNLMLVEHRVLRRLAQAGMHMSGLDARRVQAFPIPEDLALYLGLLFRTLAPMRSAVRMRAVAEGIEQMGREEASYWLSMALHRENPRRVLTALRYLLTDPER